jgi:hypothetical protein
MKSFYIIVTAGFIAAMSGRESPVNKGSFFGYSVTLSGEYVVSINAPNDFPGAFDSLASTKLDKALEVKALSAADFPPVPPMPK